MPYALIGRMLGSREQVDHLLVGNPVAIMAIDATVVVLPAVGERRSGTPALMVAAPSTHLAVYSGRGPLHLALEVCVGATWFAVAAR